MVENTCDVVKSEVTELVQSVIVMEDVHPITGQKVMDVHPVPGLLGKELREEGDDFVPPIGYAVGQHLG